MVVTPGPCRSAPSQRLRPLPYCAEGELLFARLKGLPWAQWLDGGGQGWDIFVAAPATTLVSREGLTTVSGPDGEYRSAQDPLELLRELLGPPAEGVAGLPFCGGALGYFSYDLGRRLSGLDSRARWPEMAVGIYHWAVLTDHERRRSWLVGGDASVQALLERPPTGGAEEFRVVSPLAEEPDAGGYARRFAAVQNYIRDGDCYQINLARRLRAGYVGDPWQFYRHLRRHSPVPFGAYLALPFGQVLSLSPERFLGLREGAVETRPIKGTRARDPDPQRDAALAAQLQAAPKDRAENLMIVDLLRNDLGRVCATGSVSVPELWRVESFRQVHHLVSTVRGRLAPGRDALDLLRACLPGGSITGAPKRRAMEIIDQLEPGPREVYCGSIGYIGFDGAMDSNIAIRTALCADGQVSYWAGGGVVADSACQDEFEETEAKAAFFRTALAELTPQG